MTQPTTRVATHRSLSAAKTLWVLGTLLLALLATPALAAADKTAADETAADETAAKETASPCQGSLDFLADKYEHDEATQAAFQATFDGLQPLPPGYASAG